MKLGFFQGSLEVLGATTSISTRKLKKIKAGGIVKYFVDQIAASIA